MISYSYSNVNDMSGNCVLNILHAEIAVSSLGASFDGLRRDGDVMQALFEMALSPANKVILDDLIAAHTGSP